MTDLVRYEVASATLAEASSVDEVKDVATRLVKHPEFADILSRAPRSYFFRNASSSDHDWVAAFSL
jgi:hypothetical protein